MPRTLSPRPKRMRCAACGASARAFEILHHAGPDGFYLPFCNPCSNRRMAEEYGVQGFEAVPLEPVSLKDAAGRKRKFHFVTRLLPAGIGVAIHAFEVRYGFAAGYRFEVIGGQDEDQLAIFARLLEKMRRALARRHIEESMYGLGIADSGVVRGHIESDLDSDHRMPLLVIDGREIAWDHFGEMLMTYEGWQFRLQILDRSEEA